MLKELNPEFIVVVAYGKIIPGEILKIPEYGCINLHASLLPKYRGAAPIQWALIKGEKSQVLQQCSLMKDLIQARYFYKKKF